MSKTTTNNITLDLGAKEFTINDDPNRVIWLNPSDMSIIIRVQEAIPRFDNFITEYSNLFTSQDDLSEDDTLLKFKDAIKSIDADLREILNYVFDYDVCSVLKPTGTMMDLVNGEFVFIIIMSTLLDLYSDAITEETSKLINNMKKRTAKYTNRDHKRKGTK